MGGELSDKEQDGDSGTLSGTRLNSKLEDLGASITVVTKQQMLDTAVLDINDVFRYEASTEGTDNFTTFNRNRSGGVNDQVQSNPQQSNGMELLVRKLPKAVLAPPAL